jgi:DegV family protein with EDD domain
MIKIVTDSTAYLPEEIIRRHDIRVLPLYVHFGHEAFRDGVDLTHEQFYARLKEAAELPTTSQPSAGDFHSVFEELAAAGHEIITLTISSKLSGTWDSAMTAKDMLPDASIHIVDTLTTSLGQQLIVEAAAEAVAAGATAQEVVDQAEALKQKVFYMFMVDTLEYLAKGGRIGNARAFLGTLLSVKPILSLQDGVIEPLEQVRSRRKAHARMIELVAERLGDDAPRATIGVANGLAAAEAALLTKKLVERLGCGEPACADIGSALGVHTGPGVIGIAGYV